MTNGLFIDHYKNLGIEYKATKEEVKRAFRKLAKLTHPDKNEGNALLFLSVYSSYEILANRDSRLVYDKQYQQYYFSPQNSLHAIQNRNFIDIPPSRIQYPTNIALLLEHGLLGERLKKRHIKYFLNIDYDMELHLKEHEFACPISVDIPVTTRAYCPECLSSDPYCQSCSGLGAYKTNSSVKVKFLGGLSPGSIITVNLRKRKLGNLTHFKKNQLLIKLFMDELKLVSPK